LCAGGQGFKSQAGDPLAWLRIIIVSQSWSL